MKKLLLTLLLSTTTNAAEVTFINKCKNSTIDVTYTVCIYDAEGPGSACSNKTVTLTPRFSGEKYQHQVPQVNALENQPVYVYLLKMVRKDKHGNTVSKSEFNSTHHRHGCFASFRPSGSGHGELRTALIFDDIDGSPILTCYPAVF
jgi:hypothetical protein